MNMTQIAIAAAVVAGSGLLLGILLGIAGKLLAVAVNEKEVAVREFLPGANCGGCGYAGCDAYAEAVAAGNAPATLCSSVNSEDVKKIGEILGQEVGEVVRRAAVVCCSGSYDHTGIKYEYEGIETCEAAAMAPGGGPLKCQYGCLGYGSCAKVCPQQCIEIINGVAVVDRDRCIACGKCVDACPKNLIMIQPADQPYTVRCSSHDKGKAVKAVCDIGCIGCGICAKNCPVNAIQMDNDLARIDPDICISCGVCAEKCPVKVIY